MSKVLGCAIYKIIDRYICIDYLGTETKRDYKGDTLDKTLDSRTKDSDVLKKMMIV